MMKRIKGVYEGKGVVLIEDVDLAPKTEVEVLIPDVDRRPLIDHLDRLAKLPPLPPEDVPTDEEIVALVHEVRAKMRSERE